MAMVDMDDSCQFSADSQPKLIDKVVQYIYVSDIEAIQACIRFLDDDDDDNSSLIAETCAEA